MTVRRQILLVFSLVALLAGAGCGGGDPSPATPEIDDPYYRQGQQLVKQGRTQEALSAYLKAIERRGSLSSAESHLEAGVIYLNHSKDPFEAYHHFREYLSQQPNSRDSQRVRELLNTAKRDVMKTLLGQQPDNAGVRTDLLDQIERLKRENESLTAELTALRNSATAPIPRTIRTPATSEAPVVRVNLPETAPIVSVEESPLSAAPAPPREEPPAPNPTTTRPAPTRSNPQTPAAPQPGAARRHVVVQGDSLYGLAKKYYGTATNAKAEAIYAANRDVMKNMGDLRPGMEIKIP